MQTATSKTHTGEARAARGGKQVIAKKAPEAGAGVRLIDIDIDLVDPSKTNPRKDFGDLAGLASSIEQSGILEPCIVRPKGKRFEIVAGERRYRAGKLAQLDKLLSIVRELSDADAIEIQGIENIQRQNLKPLEEAAQYRLLINTKPDKFSAEQIGKRQGKSAQWVWDLMKLLDLIPEAKKLLDEGRISVNHAIPIARLTVEQQKKVIHPENGGLFEDDRGDSLQLDAASDVEDRRLGKEDPYHELKAKSVRELNSWIHDHIRFEIKQAASANPLLFDIAAEKVDEAQTKPGRGKKVIHITFDSFVQPSAKSDERVFGPRSWKRADGTEKTTQGGYGKPWKDSPTCEFSVLGVVVVGPGYGQTFEVCTARDKCETHWATEIRQKKQASTAKTKSAGAGKPAKKSQWQIDQEHREEREREGRERWKTLGPALRTAMIGKLKNIPAVMPKTLFQLVLNAARLPKDTTQAGLAHALLKLHCNIPSSGGGYYSEHWEKRHLQWASALGVNVKTLVPTPDVWGAKSAAKKKARK